MWTVEACGAQFLEDSVLGPELVVPCGVNILVVSHEKRPVARGAPVSLLAKSRLGASRGTIDTSFSCLVTNVGEPVTRSSKTEEMFGTLIALIHERGELAFLRIGAGWALPRPLSSLGAIATRRAVVHRPISVHVADGFFKAVPSTFTGLAIVPVFSELSRPVSCSWAFSWLRRSCRAVVPLGTVGLFCFSIHAVISSSTVSALFCLSCTSFRSEGSQRTLDWLFSSFFTIVPERTLVSFDFTVIWRNDVVSGVSIFVRARGCG